MSWQVTMKVQILDLDAFSEVCTENGMTLKDDLTVHRGSTYLGKLKGDKKDGDNPPSYQFITDSDYVGKGRSSDMNKIMRDYSEKVCYKRIGAIGTVLERTVDERGIKLKICVNA